MATSEKHMKILKEARERLKWAMDNDDDNRKKALDDLEFIAKDGAQWPASIRSKRESEGRPCITVNKMPTFIDQVVGDQRQNRPALKVFPVDSKGDKRVAEILGGWIRNVTHISVADPIIDHAFEHSVACGYGAFRVTTRYTDDDSFEQDAIIEKIENALSVWWGPSKNYDRSDAPYCFIVYDMPRQEYKDTYGDDGMPFNAADSQYVEGWCTSDTIRVAEYFVKEPVKKTIYLLEDGRVVDSVKDGETVKNKREVNSYKIMWYLLTGDEVKEERAWAGKKYIPVIPVWGKEFNVGGKRVVRGLVRNAKDPQRMYNYWQSADTEHVALTPKAPFILTPKMVQGHDVQWRQANTSNFPYLLINPDDKAPGWPQRQPAPEASSAMTTKITMADQEIRDTMGLQKAALGMQSNERSGKAIMERKKEGDTGTFAFFDNLVRSMEHLGRVLLDIAPVILDTERIIRLGLDNGGFKSEAINVSDPDNPGNIINDMTVGKYDVVAKVGPSFATQRSEARQSMSEFIQYYPAAAPLIGDIFAESMDWPRSDEVAKRLKVLLPPEIKAQIATKEAEESGDGLPPPTTPDAALPPSPPSQEQMQQIAKGEADLKISQLKVMQEAAKLDALVLENRIKARELGEEYGRPTMPEDTGSVSAEPVIPGRADGGPVTRNTPYVVGESGPELFVPQESGNIVPSENTKSMPIFDPDGDGYDYLSAMDAGLTPDETGHWPSRNPETGQILKGAKHPTFYLTIQGENEAGYKIVKGKDGKYYSIPVSEVK